MNRSAFTSSTRKLSPFCVLAVAALTGCHAHRGDAAFTITVKNQGADIHQLEVDYPNASFGRDALKSGATFTYPPKIIGSGPIKVMFNDAKGKSHAATGPVVQEGLHKNLVISIGEDEGIIFQDLPVDTP